MNRKSEMSYRRTHVIGGKGSGADRFQTALLGVTVDDAGQVYVVGDRQVKVFDASGRLLRHWATGRPGRCIAVDRDGQVYVGEAGQIEVFQADGKRQSVWLDREGLGLVTSLGLFDDWILVGDAQGRRIRRFDRNRQLLNEIGHDNRPEGFAIPNGHLDFCLDAGGVVHVAHSGKHRVERYSSTGKELGRFGHFGMRDPAHFRGCCNPTNVALLDDGRVVVTEKAGPRVKVYDKQGELLAVMGEDEFDANCRNIDVAVDGQNRIYAVDTVRLQICVFAAAPEVASRGAGLAAKGVLTR